MSVTRLLRVDRARQRASVAVFGSRWLVQFVILDRVLFRPRRRVTLEPV